MDYAPVSYFFSFIQNFISIVARLVWNFFFISNFLDFDTILAETHLQIHNG